MELNICIGVLKKKAAIHMEKKTLTISDPGIAFLKKESLEEKFIKKFKDNPIELSAMSDEDKFAFESLKKRKQTNDEKETTAHMDYTSRVDNNQCPGLYHCYWHRNG